MVNNRLIIVMDHAEMCRLIIARHFKLKALRQQAANDNQTVKRLFMGALRQLLTEQSTLQPGFDEISQLLITASPIISKALAGQIIPHIKSVLPALEEHCIWWMRALDGSMEKRDYPNLKTILQKLKMRNQQRELSRKFASYLQEFQKNFNQLHDQRVEFFEDFDDDALSESIGDDSKIEEIIFLNVMELKMARNKLEREKLTEQALGEQINKIRYFVTLKPPAVLTDSEKKQYEKELNWARNFLANQEEEMRKNPSLSINQTFNISLDEENIEIVNKKDFQQRRKLKDDSKTKEIFVDSVDLRSQMGNTNKNIERNIDKGKAQYKASNPNISSKTGSRASPQQEYISPIKHISDPKYAPNLGESMDSELSIRNDDKTKMQVAHLRSQMEEQQEQDSVSDLVVHKYKQEPKDRFYASQQQEQKPRDFSITENYFNRQSNNAMNIVSPPKSPQTFKSQTMKQWKKSQYMSPVRNSRCKLSQFTSNKKQRKQLVPRERISLPEDYAISPYIFHFTTVNEFNKFRRDCFERNFTIFASPQLTVACSVLKEVNTEIRLQIVFTNNTNLPLEVENIYKIPKCFHIEKKVKINRKFTLHTTLKHIFTLDVEEFPLEACLLNIKYRASNLPNGEKIEAIMPLPVTILNFVQYLHTSQTQWTEDWTRLSDPSNKQLYSITRHLEVDRQVIPEEFNWILKESFIHAGFIEGYSIQDFGSSCYYSSLNGLKFLLRLSVRVDNIISLDAVSCKPVNQNEEDFIRYVINIWMMLLSKLYF